MDQTTRRDFLAASVALAMPQLPSAQTAADQRTTPKDLTLWYDKPAAQWVDALPIGNGRLGAMVFGGGDDVKFPVSSARQGLRRAGEVAGAIIDQGHTGHGRSYKGWKRICRKQAKQGRAAPSGG